IEPQGHQEAGVRKSWLESQARSGISRGHEVVLAIGAADDEALDEVVVQKTVLASAPSDHQATRAAARYLRHVNSMEVGHRLPGRRETGIDEKDGIGPARQSIDDQVALVADGMEGTQGILYFNSGCIAVQYVSRFAGKGERKPG